jgi:hypothetical protein
MATPYSIRQATLEVLESALGSVFRVRDSKTLPWTDADLPGLSVYTGKATEINVSHGRTPAWQRTEELAIEIRTAAATEAALAQALDDAEEAVRAALFGSAPWLAQFQRLERSEVTKGRDAESNQLRGIAQLLFFVVYVVDYPLDIEGALSRVRIAIDMADIPGPISDGQMDAEVVVP